MKPNVFLCLTLSASFAFALALMGSGCASSNSNSPGSATAGPAPNRFVATDGRIIDIGKSASANGGTRYNNPHMEKEKCWVASGFNFNGYDTLYIAPTLS